MCIAHLRCAFLIMSGGHHVNACFDQMLCLCDGAGDHDRQIPNQLLSLQRSPTPAVMSILPVGPPPCSRRAVSRALAHHSLESLGEFLSRFFDPLGETVRGPSWVLPRRARTPRSEDAYTSSGRQRAPLKVRDRRYLSGKVSK